SFRQGLDQIARVLPLVGVGILFQTIHALPELVQLHEGRLNVESHHSAGPLAQINLSTRHLLYRLFGAEDSGDWRFGGNAALDQPPDSSRPLVLWKLLVKRGVPSEAPISTIFGGNAA